MSLVLSLSPLLIIPVVVLGNGRRLSRVVAMQVRSSLALLVRLRYERPPCVPVLRTEAARVRSRLPQVRDRRTAQSSLDGRAVGRGVTPG